MPDEIPQPSPCPADCPNRRNEAQTGRYAAYAFALIASLFLGWQCLSAERRSTDVSPTVWMPCLVLIGTALGVQIDPASIATLLNGGK